MNSSQIIVIIGLPGSGKSSFSENFCQSHKIFDDFINIFYSGELMDNIKNHNKVCIIDPRLCVFAIFFKYITIIEKYASRKDIQLILFENNPSQCEKNVSVRNDGRILNNTIKNYSGNYSIDNYSQWNCYIMPVYYPTS